MQWSLSVQLLVSDDAEAKGEDQAARHSVAKACALKAPSPAADPILPRQRQPGLQVHLECGVRTYPDIEEVHGASVVLKSPSSGLELRALLCDGMAGRRSPEHIPGRSWPNAKASRQRYAPGQRHLCDHGGPGLHQGRQRVAQAKSNDLHVLHLWAFPAAAAYYVMFDLFNLKFGSQFSCCLWLMLVWLLIHTMYR